LRIGLMVAYAEVLMVAYAEDRVMGRGNKSPYIKAEVSV